MDNYTIWVQQFTKNIMKLNNPKQQKELNELIKKYRKHVIKSQVKAPPQKNVKHKCVCSVGYFNKWETFTKSEYLSALAAPKPVRLRPWPNPLMDATLPINVSKAAMYGAIPQRINELAEPKRRKPIVISEEVSVTHSDSSINTISLKKYNRRKSRLRIEFLSRPKPYLSRHVHSRCSNTEYQEKTYFKPKKVAIKSTEEWIKHLKWLKKNAAPKKKTGQTFQLKKYPKLTKEQSKVVSDRLSTLPECKQFVPKLIVKKTEPRPIGRIVPMEFGWINRLSVPRKLNSETMLNLNYNPTFIPRSVLRAKTTERTKQLAEPKIKKETEKDTELKDNPFKVQMSALKYKATKRILRLAQPRRPRRKNN